MRETCTGFDPWVGTIPWRKERLSTPVFLDLPCSSIGKESACNVGDLGSIPGLGRSPGKGKGYPLQYSGLENSMDCIIHGVAKSWTQLSDFHFTRLGAQVTLFLKNHLHSPGEIFAVQKLGSQLEA